MKDQNASRPSHGATPSKVDYGNTNEPSNLCDFEDECEHDMWLADIASVLIEQLEVDRSDAQALVESNSFTLLQEWTKGSDACTAANCIIDR